MFYVRSVSVIGFVLLYYPSNNSTNTCREFKTHIYILEVIPDPRYSDPACFIGVDG
jgi:hypothetical protein